MAGRIKIERYKPLEVHTPPVPGGGYIQVDASVGKYSLSPVAQLGLEIAQGLPSVAQSVSAQMARDDEAAVKDADARLGAAEQALLFDPQTGYFNSTGQDALNQAPVVLDTYRQAQEREAESAANEEQRRMLEDLAARRLATFSEQVERHSATERERWYDTASDHRIALMQADAGLNWSDDAILRRALGTVRAEVRDKAEHHGWPSALTETALREQTSRTLASAIEAAVERDPERAHSLRTRYDQHIESHHRISLDALLTEAQTRRRARQASDEILNATPPDGQARTPQWRLQQAKAIAEPAVRAATLRTLHAAAAATEARARTLAEQVLARVLKEGLTEPSQIPVREWVALDTERRQAIETRIDHNTVGTEPPPNPALVDELATQMTEAPADFARRDLMPSVAHLPLPQWQRFRDLQAGIRRNDPAIQEEAYAIKRSLQLTAKILPPSRFDETATNFRAELVEEVGTWRRIHGNSPDDSDIAEVLKRHVSAGPYVRALEGDSRWQLEATPLSFVPPPVHQREARHWSDIHRVQGRKNHIDNHHDLPQQDWNPRRMYALPFSKAARDVFDSYTYPIPRNQHWNGEHAEYNRLIREALYKYLEENKITRRKMRRMSAAEAEKLYQAVVVNNPNEKVQKFRLRVFRLAVKNAYRRTIQKSN